MPSHADIGAPAARDGAGAAIPASASGATPGAGATRRSQFLARRTYRRHRLQDAARLLPVFGALLIFGPVVILSSDASVSGASGAWLVYFIGVWLLLIVIAAVLGRVLKRGAAPEGDLRAPLPLSHADLLRGGGPSGADGPDAFRSETI